MSIVRDWFANHPRTAVDPDRVFPICVEITAGRGGGSAYLNHDGYGRLAPAKEDMKCERFSNGVFPTRLMDGEAYANLDLQIVHHTYAPFATRFVDGFAIVCVERPVTQRHPLNAEHIQYIEGRCGLIDTDFETVLPFEYDYQSVVEKRKALGQGR
jgi:hypothetical protein